MNILKYNANSKQSAIDIIIILLYWPVGTYVHVVKWGGAHFF